MRLAPIADSETCDLLADSALKKAQRAFFKDVYNLLIGKDTGPRLGTFLWAVDRKRVASLLAAI